MRRGWSALRLARGAVAVIPLLLSCANSPMPLRFPQVEQATEAMHGGGERYRDHRTCVQSSTTANGLIECMDAAHWHFVEHGTLFPESECWQARERGELERLTPECFVRAPEHP